MRHLGSIVLSLLLVPAIYVLSGIGAAHLRPTGRGASADDYANLGVALAALTAAAVIFSILILARLSPLGLVLGGLFLAGMSAWAIFDADSFVDTLPGSLLSVKGAARGFPPLTLVLAVPLIITAVSPRRWRRWASPPAALVSPAPAYNAAPPYGSEPAYSPVFPPAAAANSGYPPAPQSSGRDSTSVLPIRPTSRPAYDAPPVWPAAPAGDEPLDTERTRRL